MSLWQIILLVVIIFIILVYKSLSMEPSKSRKVIRIIAAVLFVAIGFIAYTVNHAIQSTNGDGEPVTRTPSSVNASVESSLVQGAACNYSDDINPVFSFPPKRDGSRTDYRTKLAGVCFGSKEMTSVITESDSAVVTSSLMPDSQREFFYITTYGTKTNVSKLMALMQLPNGKPVAALLMTGKDSSDPKNS